MVVVGEMDHTVQYILQSNPNEHTEGQRRQSMLKYAQ
jgi:hypothetical protein